MMQLLANLWLVYAWIFVGYAALIGLRALKGNMSKILHPSPYTGLESCEVCWADENETEITIYKGTPYCEIDLERAIQFEGASDE